MAKSYLRNHKYSFLTFYVAMSSDELKESFVSAASHSGE